MQKKLYLYSLLIAGTVTILSAITILSMFSDGREPPKELLIMFAASSGVVFGGRFINPPNGS